MLTRSMLLALASMAATLAAPIALAVTFTVNSTLDQPDDLTVPDTCHTVAGTCTLRAAVMQANRVSGAGATIVVPSGIYMLTLSATGTDGETSGDLNLTTPASGDPVITIAGAGADTTIIDGNQLDRVFRVDAKRTVAISAVTIRNGFYPNGGGGIENHGSLMLSGVTITGNHSANGGGGGIRNWGSLTMTNSTISQNIDDATGGGVYNLGDMALIDSTVSLNLSAIGGGITNGGLHGNLTVKSSTIYGNNATGNGGGIFNISGEALYIISSTISQNNANGDGGGIHNWGTANVYNTSIVFNGADADADKYGGSGGGVFNYDAAKAKFNLRNSLVAGNYVHNAPVYDDCTGTLTSYGRNLFWMVVGCTIVTGSGSWELLNTLNTLGPLQDNGGATPTHALLPGSSAIDGGDPAGCVGTDGSLLATDQRGLPLAVGARCDIGAYEYSPPPPTAIAIEYRHAEFDHYFVTAIADEIAKLDNGTFVGWTRTGQSFKVYSSAGFGLPGVCRFFSTAFAPKSSHFYTPDASECAIVQANHDWLFEAVVFYMANTNADGNCAANTQHVYRLYNNGQGAAPNHRYTTSLAIRSQMLAQGWISEGYGPSGVIMCAPL